MAYTVFRNLQRRECRYKPALQTRLRIYCLDIHRASQFKLNRTCNGFDTTIWASTYRTIGK